MQKLTCFIFATINLSALLITQSFAEENNAPTYVNINSVTQLITFGSDKTAKIEIPADQVSKTILVSLPPGNTKNILLPFCHNQHVTSSQSATCPFSTPLTLVDDSPNTQEETKKHMTYGAIIGAFIGGFISGGISCEGICCGILGVVVGIVVGGLIGSAIGSG